MPFAVDDADGDLALALGKRVMLGMEMGAERSSSLCQLGVMDPDLARPAELAADLDQKAITVLLLRRHLLIGDLGVPAEGWRIGHLGFPSQGGLAAYPAMAAPDLSTREGREDV
jgi:hypothetical protein